MMKKIQSLLMIMLLSLAVVPLTFAEENETMLNETSDDVNKDINVSLENNDSIDEVELVTDEEVDILSDVTGAQMRLLQLQKRVEIQIEGAQIIINDINSNSNQSDFDTSRLEEIVEEFEVIVSLIEDFDLERSSDELAQDYVAIKKDTIDLTKEFRDISKNALSKSDKDKLKVRVEEHKRERLNEKNAKIEKLKNKHNFKKVENLALELGYNIEDAKLKLESGEMNMSDVRKKLRELYVNLTPEEKKEVNSAVKESKIKQNVELKAKVQQKKNEIKAKAEQRREELKNKAEQKRQELKAKVEQKKNDIKSKIEKEKGENFKSDKKDKVNDTAE